MHHLSLYFFSLVVTRQHSFVRLSSFMDAIFLVYLDNNTLHIGQSLVPGKTEANQLENVEDYFYNIEKL